MKVPGGTSGPTVCRSSLLYTKLSVAFVLKLRVSCGSKCTGSQPRTRRMPPRLGCPASAPQSAGGRERGQVDSVTPAARPALRSSRRRTPWVLWVCCVGIGDPPIWSKYSNSSSHWRLHLYHCPCFGLSSAPLAPILSINMDRPPHVVIGRELGER